MMDTRPIHQGDIAAFLESFKKFWNSQDFEGLVETLFSKDVVEISENGLLRGRQSVLDDVRHLHKVHGPAQILTIGLADFRSARTYPFGQAMSATIIVKHEALRSDDASPSIIYQLMVLEREEDGQIRIVHTGSA